MGATGLPLPKRAGTSERHRLAGVKVQRSRQATHFLEHLWNIY